MRSFWQPSAGAQRSMVQALPSSQLASSVRQNSEQPSQLWG
jgi:hypothetical protein